MSILSALDLFGIQPGLTLNCLAKFKSIQGFLITILAIAITIVAALSPVNNWLYRLNPLIVQETKLNTGSTFIGGKQNPLFFGLRCVNVNKILTGVNNLGAMSIEGERIPQPSIKQLIVKNGQLFQENEIFLDKCESKSKEDFVVGYNTVHDLYCLNDEIELYDRKNGRDSSRLLVMYDRKMFYKIYNDQYANCGVSILYQNSYLDASNYDNFLQFDISSEEVMAKPSPEFLFQTLTFKKQTFRKKLPMFSSSSNEERVYSTLDRSYSRLTIKPPEIAANLFPIMAFTFEFSKKEDIFNLKYFEFEDLLSTIGGTFGLIISLLRVFALELNKIPMKAQIMNSIFKFYKVKENNAGSSNIIDGRNTVINQQHDLSQRKNFLKQIINNKAKTKSSDSIGTFDLYKLKIKNLCKRKLTNREEFIESLEKYVINSSNIENMSKLYYIVAQLSKVLIGPSYAKFIGPPEVNLDKTNGDFFDLNKEVIFENNVDYHDLDDLNKITEDLTITENTREYILKKYEESNNK